MKSHIKIEDYSRAELSKVEGKLRKQGYRLVGKNSEKDLLPGEFIKQRHFTLAYPAGAEHKWSLRWRVR